MANEDREKDKLSDAPLERKNRTELLRVLYPTVIHGPEDKPDPDFLWKTKVNAKLAELVNLAESLRTSIFMEDLDVFYKRVDEFLGDIKEFESLLEEEDD